MLLRILDFLLTRDAIANSCLRLFWIFFELSPPQSRHVERPQPKNLEKVMFLVETRWIHGNVRYLLLNADVLEINFGAGDVFSDELKVHFDMHCASMKDRTLGFLNAIDVVAMYRDWFQDGHLQVLHLLMLLL